MTIKFDRPVGSHADCKEMEYVSTLHQTAPRLRKNGSVTADDVANHLVSRHGIKVSKEYLTKVLMPELAGGMEDSESTVFDIAELVSILLIPHLRKEAASDEMEDLFGKVANMIQRDVLGQNNGEVLDNEGTLVLDRALMIKILETYGEDDVPEAIIDQMLQAAGVTEDGGEVNLNAFSLAQATTGDVQQWDPEWENEPTTHYHDVLDGTTLDDNLHDNDPDMEIAQSKFDNLDGTQEVERVFNSPQIDFVAENYRSKAFNVILWVLTIVAFFTYALQTQTTSGQQDCSSRFRSEFGCRVVNAIINWLIIFAQLTILGTLFVALSSAGNSIYLQRNIQSVVGVLVGFITLFAATILSYALEIKFFLIDTTKSDYSDRDAYERLGYGLTMLMGLILMLFQIKGFIYIVVPRQIFLDHTPEVVADFFLTTGMAKAERSTKKAATFKIARMVQNAIGHHDGSIVDHEKSSRLRKSSSLARGAFGSALMDFQACSNYTERVGGIRETFEKMWDGTLFREEGIWIHGRLYAMNLAQIWIAVLYIALYFVFLYLARDVFDAGEATWSPSTSPAPTVELDIQDYAAAFTPAWTEALDGLVAEGTEFLTAFWSQVAVSRPDLVVILGSALLNSTDASENDLIDYLVQNTDLNVVENFVEAAKSVIDVQAILANATTTVDSIRRHLDETGVDDSTSNDDLIEALTPSRSQVYLAVTIGGLSAVIVTVALATIWLPSSISTIRQFRCGAIGSLHDRDFQQYRAAPDLTTILFGSTFWGTLYSSGVIFLVMALLTFIVVWDVTKSVVINLIAQLIGILVTLSFKVLVLMAVRKVIFSGFMRKRPSGGNCMLLIFECWSLGLTVGTMAIRMIKLILISFFYIGRLDTPLFAKGVGNIGPVPLDSHPIQFRKDLLVHDAHRHPYMERLAVVYLLKLRFGEEFGSRAGGAWRLIFTEALMPWMRKYRLDDDDEEDEDESDYFEQRLKRKLERGKYEGDQGNQGNTDAEFGEEDEEADSSDEARQSITYISRVSTEEQRQLVTSTEGQVTTKEASQYVTSIEGQANTEEVRRSVSSIEGHAVAGGEVAGVSTEGTLTSDELGVSAAPRKRQPRPKKKPIAPGEGLGTADEAGVAAVAIEGTSTSDEAGAVTTPGPRRPRPKKTPVTGPAPTDEPGVAPVSTEGTSTTGEAGATAAPRPRRPRPKKKSVTGPAPTDETGVAPISREGPSATGVPGAAAAPRPRRPRPKKKPTPSSTEDDIREGITELLNPN